MKLPWVSRRMHEDVRHYLQREAERSDQIAAAYKEIAQERGARARELEAKCDRLVAALTDRAIAMAMPVGTIPDPPSVSAADAKVAVSLRDREAPPLKRPLRPGEDE